MRKKSIANKLPCDFDALSENGWESNINANLRKVKSHSSVHALKVTLRCISGMYQLYSLLLI